VLKQVAATLLLILLFFNWTGYRLFMACMQNNATATLQSRLDNNQYDRTNLRSIKLPVRHLAYSKSSPSFERIDGRVSINGTQYRYVLRRLWKDSLEFLCIQDIAATKFQGASDEFFKMVNGLQDKDQKRDADPQKVSLKILVSDYCIYNHSFLFQSFSSAPSKAWPEFSAPVFKRPAIVVDQPPDHIS